MIELKDQTNTHSRKYQSAITHTPTPTFCFLIGSKSSTLLHLETLYIPRKISLFFFTKKKHPFATKNPLSLSPPPSLSLINHHGEREQHVQRSQLQLSETKLGALNGSEWPLWVCIELHGLISDCIKSKHHQHQWRQHRLERADRQIRQHLQLRWDFAIQQQQQQQQQRFLLQHPSQFPSKAQSLIITDERERAEHPVSLSSHLGSLLRWSGLRGEGCKILLLRQQQESQWNPPSTDYPPQSLHQDQQSRISPILNNSSRKLGIRRARNCSCSQLQSRLQGEFNDFRADLPAC